MITDNELLVEAEAYALKRKAERLFGQSVCRARSTDDFQTEAYIDGYKAGYVAGRKDTELFNKISESDTSTWQHSNDK